jgi:hypothetical protein
LYYLNNEKTSRIRGFFQGCRMVTGSWQSDEISKVTSAFQISLTMPERAGAG